MFKTIETGARSALRLAGSNELTNQRTERALVSITLNGKHTRTMGTDWIPDKEFSYFRSEK